MKKIRRKRKLKIKRILILLTIIILITTICFKWQNIKIFYLSKTTDYDKDSISVFIEKNIIDDIQDEKYSMTLEEIIKTDYYNNEFLKEYLNIKYQENDNFIKNINSLLNLGYSDSDINKIYEKLTDESINILINNDYIEDIANIISIAYFKEDNLSRYLNYYTSKEDTIENTITFVNIGLDNEYYTNVTKIKDQNDILVLVNKYNSLNKNYIPTDLKTISSKYQWLGRSNQLRNDAAKAFEEMCKAALKDNITIYAGSGYRSYATQKYLYDNYVATDGFVNAETYSARPGFSEHQTGLAIDIANKTDFIDKNDKEYNWLINNSYKFGYILRYPKNKDKITGYMYEEWHYRYVGKEIAKEVYESNLTYDEYIARKVS